MTQVSPEATAAPPSQPPAPEPMAVTDAPRRELMIGGAIIVAFFVIFLGWAAFAPLDQGAFAQGSVAVSGNRQAVQHRDGGVVSALLVEEGDTVRQGQVLLRVGTGELTATERGVAGQVYALLAQRARLVAERDGLATIPTPQEFAGLDADDAALAQESLRIQQAQFNARRTGRSTETGVLGQRVNQLNEQIIGIERQIASNTRQSQLIREELAAYDRIDQQFVPLNRIRALQREAAALDGQGGALRAEIAQAREAIGQARLEMSGVSTKLGEDVAEQFRLIDVQLNELRPRLSELRAQIARSEVRAPASGQIVGLTIFTEGGVIQPGQTLMEVVPSEASQVIVAQISPTDIDNLQVGQDTEVMFPGLREAAPPIIHGKVTRISADSFTVEQTGATFFRVEIVVPAEELAKLGRAADTIRPGAPVEVVVLLRKRTALAYLIEPLTNNLWRSGSE